MLTFHAPKLLWFALIILTACLPSGESSTSPIQLTLFPPPTPTVFTAVPTASSAGDSVTWSDLQVRMDTCEITESFINEFGSQRLPSAGRKFLWVHMTLQNAGQAEILLPDAENFSTLYAESEFKPVYGHRQGYTDYTDLGETLFPAQALDAWLRFDIPEAAAIHELWFVFLPTSVQVGVSPSSPNYPYAGNKPTYVWTCEP